MYPKLSIAELLAWQQEHHLDLPATSRGIALKIQREDWEFEEVAGKGGKGGIKRIYTLPDYLIDEIKEKYSNYQTLIISAKNRFNIDELMELIKKNLIVKTYNCKLLIPYVNTEIAARVHRNTIVKSESFVDEGIILEVVMNEKEYNKFKDFILN